MLTAPHVRTVLLNNKLRGFTLIEISIVLVIIGLIVGGVLVGRDLIRSAEIRAVITEHQRFATASTTFREKYGEIPGDYGQASTYLGCTNCDGNSDGEINYGTGYIRMEIYYLWKHLSMARLIQGDYTGAGGGCHTCNSPGRNVPTSRIATGIWVTENQNFAGISNNYHYSIDFGNYFALVGYSSTAAGSNTAIAPTLTASAAYAIDSKADDGMPGKGRIVFFHAKEGSTDWGSDKCTNSVNSSDFNGGYNTSYAPATCNLAFIRQF